MSRWGTLAGGGSGNAAPPDTPSPADILQHAVELALGPDAGTAGPYLVASLERAGFRVVRPDPELAALIHAVMAEGNGLLAEVERHVYNERHDLHEYARLEGAAARVKRLAERLSEVPDGD